MIIYVQALDPNDEWNKDPEKYVRDVERMNHKYAASLLGITPEWEAEQEAKREIESRAAAEAKLKAETEKAERFSQAQAWFNDMLANPGDIMPGMDLVAPGPDHFVFRVPKDFTSPYVELEKQTRPWIYEKYMAKFA